MKDRYCRWVVDHPLVAALVPLLIVAIFAVGIGSLTFRSDHKIFFSETNEDLIAFDKVQEIYTKSDNLVFVLTATDGDVFQARVIEAIFDLTNLAWTLPHVRRVDSILNFQRVAANGDEITVDHILRQQDGLSVATLAAVRAAVMSEPLLVDRLIGSDGAVTGISVRFEIDEAEKDDAVPAIMVEARRIAEAMEAKWPQVDVRISGSVPMDFAFVEASEHDLSILTPIMLVVITVLVAVIVGSIWAAGFTLGIIALSITGAMGLAGFLGIPLSPPSISAPNIILTLATADCIHIIWTAVRHVGDGVSKREAIRRSLSDNFAAVFYTSATTAIGFFALTFSESPPFQHLGLIAGIGVVLAWILAISVLPAMMVWCPLRPRASAKLLTVASEGVFRTVKRRAAVACVGALVVGGAFSALAFTNDLDDRFVNYFDHSFAFRRDTDYMSERLTGIYYVDYSLAAVAPGGVADPAFLREIDGFADWLRQQPEVRHVESLTDVMKMINRAFNQGDQAAYRVPTGQEAAAQFLFFYELSLPQGLDLKDRITLDKSATRLTATLENTSTATVLSLLDRADVWMSENFDTVQPSTGIGTTVLFSHIGMRNIEEMLTGTVLAFLAITVLLVFVFRSVSLGLLGLVTNAMPAMIVLGAWALLVGEVGMAVAVIAAMTLGIVVDDTIHLISRYLKARRNEGKSAETAVRESLVHTGPAMITTSIVLATGFSCLALSGFQINAWLGLMTAVTILVALIFDCLFIPSTLLLAGKRSHAQDTPDVLDNLDLDRAELGRNA